MPDMTTISFKTNANNYELYRCIMIPYSNFNLAITTGFHLEFFFIGVGVGGVSGGG